MASAEHLAMRAYQRWRALGGRLRGRHDRWRGVRILGYHRLSDAREPLSVSPAAFRRQMEIVAGSGVTPISLERAVELLRHEVDGRYLCVTFDDGYLDNLEHGEPVLRELGIPATIFLPTGIIDGSESYFWYDAQPPAVSWRQVTETSSDGVLRFESHTVTHRWLPDLRDGDVVREFADSKAAIEQRTGRPVTAIAFPGGLYGSREQRLVREAGYQAGITTDPGVNESGQDPTALKRTLIYSSDTVGDFEAKLSGLLDGPAHLRNILYSRLGPSRRTRAPEHLPHR